VSDGVDNRVCRGVPHRRQHVVVEPVGVGRRVLGDALRAPTEVHKDPVHLSRVLRRDRHIPLRVQNHPFEADDDLDRALGVQLPDRGDALGQRRAVLG